MRCIGIVGFGRMGSAAAQAFINAGYEVYGWNRTIEKVLHVKGVYPVSRPYELASKCNLVMIFVSDDEASSEVLYGDVGLFKRGAKAVILNASTISPVHSEIAYKIAEELKVRYMHTPIMGGPSTLLNRESIVFADGDEELFNNVREYLQVISKEAIYVGDPPSASVVKLILNSIAFVNSEILSEALILAEAWNIDLDKLYKASQKTWIGAIFKKYMKRILDKEYPSSFRLKLAAKDLYYTSASGYYKGVATPLISLASQLYLYASSVGYSEDDYTRIYHMLKKMQKSI